MSEGEHDSRFRPAPTDGGSVSPPGYQSPAPQAPTADPGAPGGPPLSWPPLKSHSPQPHLQGPPPPGVDDPRLNWTTALLGIGAAFGGIVLLSLVAVVAFGPDLDEQGSGVQFFLNFVQGLIFVGAAVFAVSRVVPHPTLETFGLRSFRFWPTIGWIALTLVAIFAIATLYVNLIGYNDEGSKNRVEEQLGGPLLVIFAVIIAPSAEEFFFRGLLYRSFRNGLGVAGAAILTGLMFGAVHAGSAPAELLPTLAVFGILVALLYQKTNSLWACIILHGTFNSLVLLSGG